MSHPHIYIEINDVWYKREIVIIKTAKGYRFFGMNILKAIKPTIIASRMIRNIKRMLL
jgi:hypothetical protein